MTDKNYLDGYDQMACLCVCVWENTSLLTYYVGVG